MAIPSSKVPLEDLTTPLAPPNIGCPLWAFNAGVHIKTSASPIIGQTAPHRGDDNLFIGPPSVDQLCRKVRLPRFLTYRFSGCQTVTWCRQNAEQEGNSRPKTLAWDRPARNFHPGLGTAKEGAAIFEKGCAHCHGVNGESDGQFPALAGKKSPCRELSVRDHDMGLH